METVELGNKVFDLEIVKSDIARNFRLEYRPHNLIKMIFPSNEFSEGLVGSYLIKYQDWIINKCEKYQSINFINEKQFGDNEITNFKKRINSLMRVYQEKTGLNVNRIFFKNQKNKLGSCSSKGNISINLKLLNYPKYVQEYVVAHEIAHLKYPNHSVSFKRYLRSIYYNTDIALKWLRNNRVVNDST